MRGRRLPKGGWLLLREAVMAGESSRGQAAQIRRHQERQAGTVLNALVKQGLLVSPTLRGKVRLGFPVGIIERWLPRLYPVG